MVDAVKVEKTYEGAAQTYGFLKTSGAEIVDTNTGETVRLVGANWHGAESADRVPGGLWARNYRDMLDDMAELGLNTLRIPISPGILDGTKVSSAVRWDINPDLRGLTGIQILDKIVDYAGEIGLRIIVDMHRITPGVGKEETGLWFSNQYRENDLLADWRDIAARYSDDPTVIGFDLFNEPSGKSGNPKLVAHWNEGPDASDWHRVAERLGNAIHNENPDALIFVEGVHIYDGDWYWVGGNLRGVESTPVELLTSDRVVYSPHDYPYSVQNVPWLEGASRAEMIENFRSHWGYIYENGTAPVVIGETGGRMRSEADRLYFSALNDYLADTRGVDAGGVGMLWWTWGVNSGDTGGLLKDWDTIDPAKMSVLAENLGKMLPTTERGADFLDAETMTFTFQHFRNSNTERVFLYELRSGSATEDLDFIDKSGFLQFRAGQTAVDIEVKILADDRPDEGTENFFVDIFYMDGRRFATLEGQIEEGGSRAGTTADRRVETEQKILTPLLPDDADATEVIFLPDSSLSIAVEDTGFNMFRVTGILNSLTSTALGDWALRLEGLDQSVFSGSFDGSVNASDRKGGAVLLDAAQGGAAGLSSFAFSFDLAPAPGSHDLSIRWAETSRNNADGVARTSQDATGSGGLAVEFDLLQMWNSRDFLGAVTVTNVSGRQLRDWSLNLDPVDFEFRPNKLHNVDVVSASPDFARIDPKAWNDTLAPGDSYRFSFNGVLDAADFPEVSAAALIDELDFFLV